MARLSLPKFKCITKIHPHSWYYKEIFLFVFYISCNSTLLRVVLKWVVLLNLFYGNIFTLDFSPLTFSFGDPPSSQHDAPSILCSTDVGFSDCAKSSCLYITFMSTSIIWIPSRWGWWHSAYWSLKLMKFPGSEIGLFATVLSS